MPAASSLSTQWLWLAMVATAGLSWILVALSARMAKRLDMLDRPGQRQSHSHATPTGAGLGMFVAVLLASLVLNTLHPLMPTWLLVILPLSCLLSVLGWLDDRRGLSAALRLLIQLAVSVALLACLPQSDWQWTGAGWLVAGVSVVWIMNFYNFMDGSHGMAGGQGVFTGVLLGYLLWDAGSPALALSAWLLAAVCAGFLPWNLPRAKVFMGDAGSVPLGFAFAGIMLLGLNGQLLSVPVVLLLFAVFLTDSSLTLLKRVFNGERWYTAHKQHVYQRLIGQGWSHNRVFLLYQALNVALVVPVVMLVNMYPDMAWQLTGSLFLLMVSGWIAASHRLGCEDERQ